MAKTGNKPRVLSLRMEGKNLDIVEVLINLHHKWGHIPEATPSDYIRYLISRDATDMYDQARERRARIRSK